MRLFLQAWVCAGMLLSVLSVTGCRTTGEGPAGATASISVEAIDEVRVRVALIQAFEAEHFGGKTIFGPELVFERRGSLGDDILRGGWLSGRTVERVRIKVVPVDPQVFRVDLNAFTVQYPDDRVMEQEFAVRSSSKYKKILEDAKRRVAAVRPPAP